MENNAPAPSLKLEPNPFEQSFASKAQEEQQKEDLNFSSAKNGRYSTSSIPLGFQDRQNYFDQKHGVPNMIVTPLPLNSGNTSGNGVFGVNSPMQFVNLGNRGQYTPSIAGYLQNPPVVLTPMVQQPGIQVTPQVSQFGGIPSAHSPFPQMPPNAFVDPQMPSAVVPPLETPQPAPQQQQQVQQAPKSHSQLSAPSHASALSVSPGQSVSPPSLPKSDTDGEKSIDEGTPVKPRKKTSAESANSDPIKRKQSLERNRIAAIRCRQRKKMFVDDLKRKVEAYTRVNDNLQHQCNTLTNHLQQLQQFILSCHDMRTLPPSIAVIVGQSNGQPQRMDLSGQDDPSHMHSQPTEVLMNTPESMIKDRQMNPAMGAAIGASKLPQPQTQDPLMHNIEGKEPDGKPPQVSAAAAAAAVVGMSPQNGIALDYPEMMSEDGIASQE